MTYKVGRMRYIALTLGGPRVPVPVALALRKRVEALE